MFAVLEKQNELKAVHSLCDMKYLMARGWKQQAKPAEVIAPIETQPKKRGRPRKAD